MTDVVEEHSILRVVDTDLAATLRDLLERGQEEEIGSAKIVFDGTNRGPLTCCMLFHC